MTDGRSRLPLHPAGALVCVALLLVGYPAFLILIHDLPALPALSFRRFLDPAGRSHFRFEELLLGLVYISSFVFAYSALFGRKAKIQYFLLTTALSMVGYGLGVYLTANTHLLQIYRLHTSCAHPDLQCYPYLAHGLVLLFSTAIATVVSERLLTRWANRDVFGYPATRLPAREIGLVLYLIAPTVIYPTMLMLLDGRFALSSFWLDNFLASHGSYLTFPHLGSTAGVTLLLVSIFTALFVTNKKHSFAVLTTIVASALFYSLIILDIYISGLVGRRFACADKESCLSYLEHGVLFNLAFVWSIVLVARGFKRFGLSTLFERAS